MKVGDYVRTKNGNIFQITGSDIEFASEIGSNGNLPFNAKIISSKIIDLIEVGDYVNEILINEKYIDVNGNVIVKNECDDDYYSIAFKNEDIKSVLIKEQFSQMEYRIGE